MSKSWSTAMAVSLAFGLGSCSSLPIPGFLASPSTVASTPNPVKPEVAFPPRPLTLLYTTFQDHAVLQRDRPIAVWGLTRPGAQVSVTLADETVSATADAAGKWQAMLAPLKVGGPYQMTAHSSAGKTQTIKDVMIGDVYLCSGQSNMEMPVRVASNYDADISGAANTQIRLFHVQRFPSPTPRDVFGADASWAVTGPDAVREFSAACYNFGRELQPAVNVPIGLIEDAWGGSLIEAWLDIDTLKNLGGYEERLDVLAHYYSDKEGAIKKWAEIANLWWLGHDPGSAASPAWNDPAFDDSAWPEHVLAGWWEGWGVPEMKNFDGIVWFRTTVTLTAAQAKGDAVLSLGPIDDSDTTWVNGIHIASGEGWDTKRVYKLPAGTLHEGNNLIAVGVLDTGSGGGMWGTADAKNLKLANGTLIPLTTPWRYHISADLKHTGDMPHAPWVNESGIAMLNYGMITPLGPTSVRGILWYQGESNVSVAPQYGKLLTALIESWRKEFGADVPVLIVQLPGYGPATAKPDQSAWADLREQQRLVARNVPNTGLAVTVDLGQTDNIHPTNKQEVGRRLALVAERLVYGMNVADTGPTPVAAVRTGNTVAVSFDHVGKGLVTYEYHRPIGFQVCDAAKHCSFTDAIRNKDEIDLDAAQIPDATTVRYCWADSPICNVYNSDDLPAVPFEIAITQAPEIGKQLVRKPRHHRLRTGRTRM